MKQWLFRHVFIVSVLCVLGLGFAGHRAVGPSGDKDWSDGFAWDAYRTLRLLFAELDVPDGAAIPLPLWIAAFAAPAVLLGGLLTLLSERTRNLWTRLTSRDHVVILGVDDFALSVARDVARTRRVILVHEEDEFPSAATIRREGIRTLRADAQGLVKSARVRSAQRVLVLGPDDHQNAVLAETLAAYVPPHRLWMRLDDPSAARLAPRGVKDRFTAFGIPELFAEHILGDVGTDGQLLVLAGAGPYLEELALEASRVTRIRKRQGQDGWRSIVVAGPRAEAIVDDLHEILGSASPELRAITDPLHPSRLGRTLRRQLRAFGRRKTVIVLAEELSNAAGTAFELADELAAGDGVWLVSDQQDAITSELARQTRADDTRATIASVPLLGNAATLQALDGRTVGERLERAGLPDRWQRELAQLYVQLVHERFATIGVPERRVLAAVTDGGDWADAIESAGFSVDLSGSETLLALVRRLDGQDDDLGFAIWCDAMRRTNTLENLGSRLHDMETPLGRRATKLAALRGAALKRAGQTTAQSPPENPILVVAGGADTLTPAQTGQATELLVTSLGRPRFPGTVVSGGTAVGVSAAVGDAARRTGCRAVGYRDACGEQKSHPGYQDIQATGCGDSIDQALAAWDDILQALEAAKRPLSDVRFIAFSGGTVTELEMLVARALGVETGFASLERDDQPLADRLFGGDGGIIWLPSDRATIRAWINPGVWPGSAAERDAIARRVHEAYVEKHRARKPPDDVALAPWPELRSDLKASNVAVVDDLPNKLAMLGACLQLTPSGQLPSSVLDLGTAGAPSADLELLAELEHGRYNAERLRAGWAEGRRDLGRRESPFLKAWGELDEDARLWDREIVQAMVHAAMQEGWSIVPG